MNPFTTLKDALDFINESPLADDQIDIAVAAG
jgi:hypothetical protein